MRIPTTSNVALASRRGVSNVFRRLLQLFAADCAPEPLDKQLEEEVRQLEQKSDGLARVLKEKRQSVPAALQAALSSAAKQSLERIVQDDGEPSSSSSSSEIAGLGRATAAVARASQATAGAKARLQDAGKIVAASQQGAKEASAALDRAAGMPATEAEKALAGKRGPSAMTPAAAKRRRVR